MQEFDYIIIGGGCAGLSLAYELEINNKLNSKNLAIIEPRPSYKRDKTWSFWKVAPHNFEDCVIKSWENFTINIQNKTKHLKCSNLPYQTIDSGLFYEKILKRLKQNKRIFFFKNIKEVTMNNGLIFNSVPKFKSKYENLWQHFAGFEIETDKKSFDDKIMNLMDFDCEQHKSVHFFYTLPFSKNKALIETTWLSKMDDILEKNYEEQIINYIENNLKIRGYKINYKEQGAIPLFYPIIKKEKNIINIGTAGGMTRLSTGYTFLNIQNHSKYLTENIESITSVKNFQILKKYQFLDKVFLKVLRSKPEIMPEIFYSMFQAKEEAVINFLSNKSSFVEDLIIIMRMPKKIFLKAVFS